MAKARTSKRIREGINRLTYPTGATVYQATVRKRVGGKEIKRTRSFDRLEDAIGWRNDNTTKGKPVPAKASVTVGEFLDTWQEKLDGTDRAPNTIHSYRRGIDLLRETSLWGCRLRDLSIEAVELAYSELRKLKPSYVRYGHDALSVAFGQLVQRSVIAMNPCQYAERVEVPAKEADPWTEDKDIVKFLAVADQDRLASLWRLMLCGGLRVGEALGIRRQDVDLTKNGVWVRGQFTREGNKAVYKAVTKTSSSLRFVSLDPETMAVLKATIKRTKEEKMAALAHIWVDDPHDRIHRHGFGGGRGGLRVNPGTPVHPSRAIHDRLKNLCEQAGVKYGGPHGLRHTHATWLLRHGAHLYDVSRRLGHSSTAVTQAVYAKWIPGDDRKQADLWATLTPQTPVQTL